MEIRTCRVMYVFADVDRFTVDRTNEAQVSIINALNSAFRDATAPYEGTIFLPTGDGICAGILDPTAPFDAHLEVAVHVLSHLAKWSENQETYNRKCRLRIGINESRDCIVEDINGRLNLAGAGINEAQRVMSLADGDQVMVSESAYATLRAWDKYVGWFRRVKAEIKHGLLLSAFQYINPSVPFLNNEQPSSLLKNDPIDLRMNEAMDGPGGSTAGMRRAYYKAAEEWENEISAVGDTLLYRLPTQQAEAFSQAQESWNAFFQKELAFMVALRMIFLGNMYGVMFAAVKYELCKARALALRDFNENWVNDEPFLSGEGQIPEATSETPI